MLQNKLIIMEWRALTLLRPIILLLGEESTSTLLISLTQLSILLPAKAAAARLS